MKRLIIATALCALAASLWAAPTPMPADGTKFLVCDQATGAKLTKAKYPGYTTAVLVFRDAKETAEDPKDVEQAKWPTFMSGRPEGEGSFTYVKEQPVGAFTVKLATYAQPNGDQSSRIAGEIVKDGKPLPVTFVLTKVEKQTTEQVKFKDKNGKEQTRTIEFYPIEATLTIGAGAAIPVKARLNASYPGPGEGPDRTAMYLTATWATTGKELGFTGKDCTGAINVRLSVQAFPGPAAPPAPPAG